MNGRTHIAILCLLAALPASAVQIRSHDPARHDRFTGFPSAPVSNPDFIYDNSLFTGLGWDHSPSPPESERQYALVSPRHIVCASHWPPAPGTEVRFLASDGSLASRTVASATVILNANGSASDLTLATLSAPLLPADGVIPFPYLNLASENAYLNTFLMVFGKQVRAGSGTVSSIEDISLPNLNDSRVLKFVYRFPVGGGDDANLETHDSGSPCFALVNGVAAVVGTHSAIDANPVWQNNYSTFIPHYIAGLNDLMGPMGYRMRPAYPGPTNLTVFIAPSPTMLRRGSAGELLIDVTNAGSETAGNVELTLGFPAGAGPDTLTAPDWIVDGGGDGTWLLRRATLAGAETRSFTAHWSKLPLDESLNGSLDHLSDSSPAGGAAIDTALAPSFAEWASRTGVSGTTGDPDFDKLDNLLEYALGGDPLSGSLLLDDRHPLTLQISISAGIATVSFPIREDAAVRGLSYIVEWSTDPDSGPWTTTPPAGTAVGEQEWSPSVDGFHRRTVNWPATAGPQFARLRVELDEGS